MTYEKEVLGEDQSGFNIVTASAEGLHDAVSTMVKYTVIGSIALIAVSILLKKEQINNLRKRVLSW
jgi:hypothetical protein